MPIGAPHNFGSANNLIARGDLHTVHIGRACRVPMTELARYVERLVQQPIYDATPRPYPRPA